MLRTSLFVFFMIGMSTNVFADDPNWQGSFAGTEELTVTNCSNSSWNGTSSRVWSVNHTEVNGNAYKGNGRAGGGDWSVEGNISGNTATGTFKGKDTYGNAFSGEFSNTLDGNQLTSNTKGSTPSIGCNFTGKVTATRK